jgi:hypothetical protein
LDLTLYTGGVLLVCLNTKSKKPLKPGRAPKPSKPETKPARVKAKATRKPSKGKKRTGRAAVKVTEPNRSDAAASETIKAATEELAKAG